MSAMTLFDAPRTKQRGMVAINGLGFEINEAAYHYLIRCAKEPPERAEYFSGQDSPFWLEWHRYRGIDPYAYKPQHTILPSIRRAVIDRDGHVCGICGDDVEPDDIHIDHITPRKLGGQDTLDNLQVAHSRCNMSKGARV